MFTWYKLFWNVTATRGYTDTGVIHHYLRQHDSLDMISSPERPCWNSCWRRDGRRWSSSPGRTETWAGRIRGETSRSSNPPSHYLRKDTAGEQWTLFTRDNKGDKAIYEPLPYPVSNRKLSAPVSPSTSLPSPPSNDASVRPWSGSEPEGAEYDIIPPENNNNDKQFVLQKKKLSSLLTHLHKKVSKLSFPTTSFLKNS